MKKALYKKIFEEEYPNIKIDEFTHIKEGNDFLTFDINNSIIIKFPVSVEIENKMPFEINLLKKLNGKLDIQIPELNYNSKQSRKTPFLGYEKIQGGPFNVNGSKKSVDYNLSVLGNIIRKLSLIKNLDIDNHVITANWKKYYLHLLKGIKTKAFKFIENSHRSSVEDIIGQNNHKIIHQDFVPKLIHSDLKSNHIICDKNNHIVGLIDWADAIYGDIAFEFARVLNEFGFDFFVQLFNKQSVFLSKANIERIAYYSVLIPFNKILNGINYSDERTLERGVKKLASSLVNYENVRKVHLHNN
jgi:aminoglycoside 2''-phosphotransferase